MVKIVHQSVDSDMRIYQTIKPDLEEVKTQLAEIAQKPLNYAGRGTGQNIPISKAFPSVKLVDVQLLDPSATLSDSADWYVIQKLFKDAIATGAKTLMIPNGEYVYTRGFVINAVDYLFDINAYGVKLRPENIYSGAYTGKILTVNGGRKLTVRGLWIDGGVQGITWY